MNAIKIADQIADEAVKGILRRRLKAKHVTDSSIEELLLRPWTELSRTISGDLDLIQLHKDIYLGAYAVLTGDLKTDDSDEK